MKVCIMLFLALFLSACTFEPEAPFVPVEFSVEGKWLRNNTASGVPTSFISSTTQVKDEFVFYPQENPRMAVTLKRKEVEELIGGLVDIPETVELVVGSDRQFSRHFFTSYQHPRQKISVQFYWEPGGENEVVSTLKVKDPTIPNSLFVGFMVLTPENGMVWKQQLEDLLKLQ